MRALPSAGHAPAQRLVRLLAVRAHLVRSACEEAVTRGDWVWMPHAAHFIGGGQCQFVLATYVGDFIVSTVGQYRPGAPLHGCDEDVEIGLDRLFETMVFEAVANSSDACGCPWVIDVEQEVDFYAYDDPKSAAACEKWAEPEVKP